MCLFVVHIWLDMVVVRVVLVDTCRVDMDQIGLCHIEL
jgi:hypothetical protein